MFYNTFVENAVSTSRVTLDRRRKKDQERFDRITTYSDGVVRTLSYRATKNIYSTRNLNAPSLRTFILNTAL